MVISGTNLSGGEWRSIPGMVPATIIADLDTQIERSAPPIPRGVVDVTVTTPNGTSKVSPADQFTYVATPGSVTTTYSGGSLSSVTETDTNSDGSTTTTQWNYGPNGSLLSISEVRTNTDGRDALNVSYQGGVLASITEDDYNPGGSLAESKTWTYSGGSVSIDEHDNLAGGSTETQSGTIKPAARRRPRSPPRRQTRTVPGPARSRNTIPAEAP